MWEFLQKLKQLQPESKNIVLTGLTGEALGEKALVSNGKLVWASVATWSFYSIFEHLRRLYYFPNMFFNFIGKNTLTILTWHLLAFKVVSLMIIYIYELPMKRLAEFPVILEYSHKGWWIVYFIVAILVTGGIAYCNKGIKNQWLKL